MIIWIGILRFIRDERAATAIEYGVIAGIISAGLVLTFTIFGGSLSNLFGYVSGNSANAMGG